MFETLSSRLGSVFERLKGRGALGEKDIDEAMRDIRLALLEADVALDVVKAFISAVKTRALGQDVIGSVTPGQMVVKIVHDHLAGVLGGATHALDLAAPAPMAFLVVGLQGAGKTTSVGKIARKLMREDKKKVLMASLDIYRPAAIEQLAQLGRSAGIDVLEAQSGEPPVAIARRAMDRAKREGFDIVLLDSAGRLQIDEAMMAEAKAIKDAVAPHETLLVADAMTGQAAAQVAKTFHERLGLTGIVLTRLDGDARGGAALSMHAVTGAPIKLVGTGESLDALETFHPERMASRILGMGDVVSLVERAAETVEKEEAEKLARKIAKGDFDLDDFAGQLAQIGKMGGLGAILDMLPGLGAAKKQMENANIDQGLLKKQQAIISSMTPKERRYPKLLNASRKKRVAAGSGTRVEDINRLLKQFEGMSRMMKKMKQLGKKGFMRGGPMMPPGGMPRFH